MPAPRKPLRAPFPRAAFFGGLALFGALALLFRFSELDRSIALAFQGWPGGAWPGRRWVWAEWLHHIGEAPANLCAAAAALGLGLSFAGRRWRAWRGPSLFLLLLFLLGPGLLSNTLGKGLMGRPRPLETLGFGGLWEYRAPFELGLPGRGRSFISGHASNAWYLLGFYFLLRGRARVRALLAALAFGLAMCLARVSQGAHWASDTLLAGAGLWTLAAALSPLIGWQPARAFWRRPGLRWALGLGALAWLSLAGVVYEERRFGGSLAPQAPQAPLHRELPYAGGTPPRAVAVEADLAGGSLDVSFGRASGGAELPLALRSRFRGQGLPLARQELSAESLAPRGPGRDWLGVRFAERLRGFWLARESRAELELPRDLEVEARLRVAGGALTIGPLPEGRFVIISRLPLGCQPPPGFKAWGGVQGWRRDGRPPLISLDLEADSVSFADQAPPPR